MQPALPLPTAHPFFHRWNMAIYDLIFTEVNNRFLQELLPRFPELLPPAPEKRVAGA
jgi:hypothetical protein